MGERPLHTARQEITEIAHQRRGRLPRQSFYLHRRTRRAVAHVDPSGHSAVVLRRAPLSRRVIDPYRAVSRVSGRQNGRFAERCDGINERFTLRRSLQLVADGRYGQVLRTRSCRGVDAGKVLVVYAAYGA